MPNARDVRDRFHEKYERVPWSGCWIWLASTMSRGGYGKMTFAQGEQQPMGAHRVSWLLHRGEIPPGQWVLHRCDVPACVNPGHLFLGTARDNSLDAVSKGRHKSVPWFVGPPCPGRIRKKARRRAESERPVQWGEKNWNAKLTREAVLDIRSRRMTRAAFARLYGVSFKAIHNIWTGKAWPDLTTTSDSAT